VLLISDAAASYRRFAQEAGITHETVNGKAGERARGAIHIQNVNAWHSRFKAGWCGFAASRAATSSITRDGRGCSMRAA
jgi:hypothetical protein